MDEKKTPKSIIDLASINAGVIAGFFIVIVAIIATYEVLSRKVGYPTTWTFDISIYLVIWATLLGGGYTELKNGHVGMELIQKGFPRERSQAVIQLIHALAGLVFMIVVFKGGYELTVGAVANNQQSVGLLQVPMYLVYSAIPVGAAIHILQLGKKIVTALKTF
jgi:C4-dicarboxylate transporter DctQ subunit